ncbi:hypothetical protein IWZ00DRAFT_484918 [Phyllosticta capitalensis]
MIRDDATQLARCSSDDPPAPKPHMYLYYSIVKSSTPCSRPLSVTMSEPAIKAIRPTITTTSTSLQLLQIAECHLSPIKNVALHLSHARVLRATSRRHAYNDIRCLLVRTANRTFGPLVRLGNRQPASMARRPVLQWPETLQKTSRCYLDYGPDVSRDDVTWPLWNHSKHLKAPHPALPSPSATCLMRQASPLLFCATFFAHCHPSQMLKQLRHRHHIRRRHKHQTWRRLDGAFCPHPSQMSKPQRDPSQLP